MHGSFIWGCISILACFWRVAEANTEIINIEALEASLSLSNLPPTWKVLSADSAESVFAIVPAPLHTPLTSVCNFQKSGCPYEAWVMLDLDHPHWVPFSKFTSRVSWPANYPADFLIEAMPPSNAVQYLEALAEPLENLTTALVNTRTRSQYARIRVVDTGVHPPSSVQSRPPPVPFTVILEPLYFGFLPASVAPILVALFPVVAAAWLIVAPRVCSHLSQISQDIQKDKAGQSKAH